ncbi:MAG TPA: hypothetical protein VKD72_26760 [Gemmataceae bacterium]|nr:hypothetical protein [Gemmataceae bacterium]
MAGPIGNGTPSGSAERQLVSYVVEQLWAGRSVPEVVGELIVRGLDAARASALVDAVEEELRRGGAL